MQPCMVSYNPTEQKTEFLGRWIIHAVKGLCNS
jgi:hypothetical protein